MVYYAVTVFAPEDGDTRFVAIADHNLCWLVHPKVEMAFIVCSAMCGYTAKRVGFIELLKLSAML